ncbi:MAG: hypothetical protein WBC40_02870 [Halobacteriota archaeon]
MVLTIPIEVIAWTSYTTVEDDFINYLDYVPWTHDHRKVWSPKLANLLLNTGSLIDSIFRSYLNRPTVDLGEDIDKIRGKRNPNINDFQKVYENVYSFSNREVYLLSTEEKLTPWSNWQKQNSPPDWWTAYNHVKHNRFENKTEANLENTLYALSGLFLVCVLLKEFRSILVDIGIIKGNHLAKGYLRSLLKKDERIDEAEPIIAKSKIFGYVFRTEGKWELQGFGILSRDNIYNL